MAYDENLANRVREKSVKPNPYDFNENLVVVYGVIHT
jgi:hypothetical protein